MKGNLRKFLSLLVAAAMLITLLPTAAFAAETVTEVSTAEALISEIKDGANIKLTADIDLTGSITIPMHTTVTIDLGGFTLSTEKLSTATTAIVNNGTLTVKNGIIKSSRLGISSYYYEDNPSNPMPILNVDGVTITAPGGVDDNYEAYGYNAVYSSGKATFTNSTITNGYNGISNAGGELTVENSTVSGANQGIWSSGTLFVKGGTYTSIDEYGYGICNYTGNVTIDGGTFHGYNGLYNNSGEIAINGGEFPNGVTNENYEGAAVLKIKDGVFGSVQNYSDSSLTIDGGVFGTVQNDRGSIAINGGKFTSLPEYTPEEYTSAFVKGSDGYYELKKDLPLVVEVTVGETTTSYADVSRAFSEAFSAANSKITLLADASLSGKKTLNNTSTLDLNGHNLDCSFDTGAMIEIKNSGSLTVTDSTETPGTVKITSTTTNNGAYFVKATAGTVATDKVNYVCNFGQPFYSYVFDAASASSSVTINGGNFTVQDKSRGVIKKSATAASAVINGGTFTYADNSPFILDSTLLPEGMTQNPSTGTIVANTGKTFKLVVNFPAPFTVTANGVACTSGTEMTYNEFDKVTLKLTGKNSYYYFTGWNVGETTETTDTINVTMTADTTATANMTAYEYTQEDIIEADANGVYHVTTPGQLNYLSYTSYVNKKAFAGKTILLEKDLDFTGVNYFPIGRRSSAKFAGTFDGNGKTISNMNVTAPDFCGVIGETASGAVIKNLTVKNSKFVPGGIYDTDRTYAGAIVAAATGAEILGCSSVGNTCNAWFSGAIAGHGYPIKTISDCTVSEANVSGGKNGGIVGFVGSSAAISGVTVTDSTIEGGSIIGNITEAGGTVAIENAAVTNTKDSSGNVTPVIRTSENSTSAPEITISGENTNIQASAIGNVPKECVTITGGTYTTGVDETGNAVELDVTEYIPETMTQDPTTGEVKDDPNKVVKVTTSDGTGITYYATLAEAVAAATAGDTVTLLKNIDMGATFFSVENEITIDLNGYSITSSNKNAAIVVWNRNGTNAKLTIKDSSKAGTGCVNSTTAHGIWVCNGGELILDSGKISATSSNYNYAGINISDINGSVGTVTINGGTVTGSEGIFAQTNGSLTVNGGEVTGTAYYGIFGNGSNSGTSITITGGKVMGNEWGIFHPQQNSTLTVSDNAVISGGITGIEMRAGTLNMTGGEVKGNTNGTYSTVTVEANDSGTTTNGAGIAVSQHTTNNDLTVNISGGTVTGAAAVYEKDMQDTTAGVITLNITGGTFSGTSETDGAVYSADCTGFVSGGQFSSMVPAEYCAEGFAPTTEKDENGKYTVQIDENEAVKVTTSEGAVNYYATLADAVANAKSGDTVTLLRDITGGGIKVPSGKDITIDFGGFTYTVTDPAVGSTGTETNGFQLLRDSNITFKNGTIKADPAATGLGVMIQNYSNLTLEDMDVDGSENAKVQYVLSCNNGTSTLKGNTNITAPAGQTAMDVYYWPSGSYNSVSLTLDETMTGTVTGNVSYGDDGTEGAAENAKLIVKAGTINGGISEYGAVASAETTGIEISGGTFSEPVKEEYCATGFGPVAGSGNYTVQNVNGMEAKVVSSSGEVTYVASFKIAAQNAMENDEVILLQDNVTLTAMNMKKANVTLNLNGKTINTKNCLSYAYITVRAPGVKIENGTINFNIPTRKPVIGVYKDADVELIGVNVNATQVANGAIEIFEPNATVTLTNSTLETTQCAGIYVGGTTATKDVSNAKVIIDGSTITTASTAIYDSQAAVNNHVTIKNNSTITSNVTDSFGISHNGTAAGYELTIENSTVKADNAPVGIFVSGNNSFTTDEQKGKVTITNSTVTGGTVVEAKYANITVTDSTLTATQAEAGYTPNGGGSCTGGYAIVVTDNSAEGTTPDLTGSHVTISGGTYTGVVGLENGVATDNPAAGIDSPIDITGGTFKPVDETVYSQEQMNEAVLGYIDVSKNNTQKNEDGSVVVIEGCVLGVTILDGAQVRIGQGVDTETEKVVEDTTDLMTGSGLRFIATVDRNGGNLVEQLSVEPDSTDEIGILIYPADDTTITNFDAAIKDGNKNVVTIAAKTYQDIDETVFSAALTNLKESNYNRKFTAKPYVKIGDTYYTDDQAVTRSIYQVAAGLMTKDLTGEDVTTGSTTLQQAVGDKGIAVLNAYLNQVGIRLTISGIAKDGKVAIRDEASGKSGAYTGVPFFEISESSKTGNSGVYTITLTAVGDNTTFKKFWNEYVRINNNHGTVINGITFDNAMISDDNKTITFTFNYNTAVGTQTQTANN